jgi:hypothetical protein
VEKVIGDNPIWELHSGHWVQDDKKKCFEIADPATNKIYGNQLGLDIIYGAKYHEIVESGCGRFFPPEFDYCSFCGKKLAVGEYQSDIWVPPFGGGRGLRLVSERIQIDSIDIRQENNLKWVDQDRDILSLPRPRGDYEFVVASLGTKSPVLVAFDRTTGLLDYFCPTGISGKNWLSLTPASGCRVGESKLPNWSWSAALIRGKSGFAIPTEEGPVWLFIDWENAKYTPETGHGECIGGAATLENQVFIPVLVDNSITIQSFDFAARQWKQAAEPIQNLMLQSEGECYFSVPIVDEWRRILYWVGITGLLTLDLTKHSCWWRPWETDLHPCRAVPQLGPPYQDQAGNFWQICYDDYDESQEERAFRYYKLSGDESHREDVDGGRFSSGFSCFSKLYDFWETPWLKIDKRQEQAKTIRVPLLCLNEETKTTIVANFGKGSILPILEILKDSGKTYPIELQIERPNDLPIKLKMHNVFNLNSPWELRLFIYQHHLFVYSMKEAVCYKWRLK